MTNVQWYMTNDDRAIVNDLDREFAGLINSLKELVRSVPPDLLYRNSIGENIIRSAAVIEQSFGGLTANLWDDPFEWTLPETLNAPAKVLEYLDEVEATRRHAFDSFESDDDLSKEIMTPAGSAQLLPFLLDTLRRARHH